MARKRGKTKGKKKRSQFGFLWTGVKACLALAIVLAVILAVVKLGNQAGIQIVDSPRYAVPVTEIQCDTPPGKDRLTFLMEVRMLAKLPENVQSIDPELPTLLSAAFAKHPSVAEVTSVETPSDGSIHVGLRFREAVLRVALASQPETFLVDGEGVLLLGNHAVDGLPLFQTSAVKPPIPLAGDRWDNPLVQRAIDLAKTYQPALIEKTQRGWRLTKSNGQVLDVDW